MISNECCPKAWNLTSTKMRNNWLNAGLLVELDKQSYCDLKVVNNTEHHVAFKVKTTSPKKYFVRPNTGVIQPWDACVIRVTSQAQRDYPPDMQCKDKFLLQSTIVPPHTDLDELPQDAFNKDSGKVIEECKLRVVYTLANRNSGDGSFASSNENADYNSVSSIKILCCGLKWALPLPVRMMNPALQSLKEERDSAVRQTQQLQQELELLKRRRYPKSSGFSFRFALLVALIGIMVGFLLNLSLSSPSTE
ncbi:Vesicle-associated protein 2-1 [Vitis vinifera]|uniref:Vesicle-associated protein 2-1 n=1 Tax=Vitis vinifera TaxID=29760 RepID=A0A438ESY8_VITVI|nr:Vesicle-associated protein 2-1 [Vitis vinifera]